MHPAGRGDCGPRPQKGRLPRRGAVGCLHTPTMEAVDELMKCHYRVRLILATGGAGHGQSGLLLRQAGHRCRRRQRPGLYPQVGRHPQGRGGYHRAPRPLTTAPSAPRSRASLWSGPLPSRSVRRRCRQGGYFLSTEEASKVAAIPLPARRRHEPARWWDGVPRKLRSWQGLSASRTTTTVLVAREHGGRPHAPLFPGKAVPDSGVLRGGERGRRAARKACEILQHEGAGHTFMIHAEDEAVIRRFALRDAGVPVPGQHARRLWAASAPPPTCSRP